MNPPLDLRLAPAAVSAWMATWLVTGQVVSFAPPTWIAVLASVIVGALVLVWFLGRWPNLRHGWRGARSVEPTKPARGGSREAGSWRGGVALCSGVGIAAALAAAGAVVAVESSAVAQAANSGRAATLTLTVLSDPIPTAAPDRFTGAPRYRLSLRVGEVCQRGSCTDDSATVIAIAGDAWSQLEVGSELKARGRLSRTDPGARETALFFPDEHPRVGKAPGYGDMLVSSLRAGLREASSDLGGDARALVPAIAVGDVSGIDESLDSAVKATGLSHMTAVSGSHCVVVVAVVAIVLGPVGRFRVILAVAGILAVLGLNELVRHEPSVVRATAMSLVASLGMLAGRRSRAIPALGATIIVLLIVDPWLARSYGFALSCAATCGLATLSGPWTEGLARRMPRWLAALIAVPAAAQAVCAPIIVLIEPSLTPYAVLANVVAGSALAPATLCGLAATVGYPIFDWLGIAFAWLAGWPARWIAAVARTLADMPGTTIAWAEGPSGAIGLLALTVGVGALCTRRVRAILAAAWAVISRRVRLAIGVATIAVMLVCLLAGPLSGLRGTWVPEDWAVVQCDVGQGDALAIRSGPDAAVVVDVGLPGDAAARCLQRLGVKQIDLLILSHDHQDHTGGLSEVIAAFPIREARVPWGSVATSELENAGTSVTVGSAQDTGWAGDVEWRLFGPNAPISSAGQGSGEPRGGREDSAANDDSLIGLFEVRGIRILALGDAEEAGQARARRQLTANDSIDPIDVVKVAHHGSAIQNADLAADLSPSVALFSAGRANSYGHPAPRALEIYRAAGAHLLRTDACGDIAVTGTRGQLGYLCRGP